MCYDGMKGTMFVYFAKYSEDFTYNDETDYTDNELEVMATELAVQGARESAPWLFRMDDGQVTQCTRVK
jgi:hypothetical protein